jgi:putative polyhydroxyalkanoate system protein
VNRFNDPTTLAEAMRHKACSDSFDWTRIARFPETAVKKPTMRTDRIGAHALSGTTMSKIDIHRAHHLPLADARAVIEKVATRIQEKFGTDNQWQGNTLQFARSGIKGAIEVKADEVHVTAELGMLLSAMKGTIEQEIGRKLDEHFA